MAWRMKRRIYQWFGTRYRMVRQGSDRYSGKICNQVVGGSNPPAGTNKINGLEVIQRLDQKSVSALCQQMEGYFRRHHGNKGPQPRTTSRAFPGAITIRTRIVPFCHRVRAIRHQAHDASQWRCRRGDAGLYWEYWARVLGFLRGMVPVSRAFFVCRWRGWRCVQCNSSPLIKSAPSDSLVP